MSATRAKVDLDDTEGSDRSRPRRVAARGVDGRRAGARHRGRGRRGRPGRGAHGRASALGDLGGRARNRGVGRRHARGDTGRFGRRTHRDRGRVSAVDRPARCAHRRRTTTRETRRWSRRPRQVCGAAPGWWWRRRTRVRCATRPPGGSPYCPRDCGCPTSSRCAATWRPAWPRCTAVDAALQMDLTALADELDAEALRNSAGRELFTNAAKTLAQRISGRSVVLAGDSAATLALARHGSAAMVTDRPPGGRRRPACRTRW